MSKHTCRTCPHWNFNGDDDEQCRRYPPGPDGWPRTRGWYWCGEHPERARKSESAQESQNLPVRQQMSGLRP